ncbi:hypothetical protein BIW11_10379, partial [Tropilaelaps mercedesae]
MEIYAAVRKASVAEQFAAWEDYAEAPVNDEAVVRRESDENEKASPSAASGIQESVVESSTNGGCASPGSTFTQSVLCAGTYHTSDPRLFKDRHAKRDLATVVVFLAWMYSRENTKLPGRLTLNNIVR